MTDTIRRPLSGRWVRLLFLLSFISSCVNLDHITRFTGEASESLAKAGEVQFSFTEFCRLYQEEVLSGKLQTDIQPLPEPDCLLFQRSDSALAFLNAVETNYLLALHNLAGKDLVNYKTDALVKGANSLSSQLKWNVTADQVKSGGNILAMLMNEAVRAWSAEKLKQYIRKNGQDFSNVSDAYINGLRALSGECTLALVNYKLFYSNALLEGTKDPSVKALIVKDYRQMESVLSGKKNTVERFAQMVDTVKTGYALLTQSVDRLTIDELKTALSDYASKLQGMRSEFNKIEHKN